MEEYKVLAMNFGSTSTKVAVYEGDTCLLQQVFPPQPQGSGGRQQHGGKRRPAPSP